VACLRWASVGNDKSNGAQFAKLATSVDDIRRDPSRLILDDRTTEDQLFLNAPAITAPLGAKLTFDFLARRFRNTVSRQSLRCRHKSDSVGINSDIGHPAPRQPDDVDPRRKGADSVCPRIAFQPIHATRVFQGGPEIRMARRSKLMSGSSR
jgi:hypothetical protein